MGRMTTERMTTEPMTTETNIQADHSVVKRLGSWTGQGTLQVRARKGKVVLDLRSPEIDGDIDIDVDLQRSVLTLLVAGDATIDRWALRFTGRGRVKDGAPGHHGARIRLHGTACDSQVRIHRAGVAELTALRSLSRLKEMHRAHRSVASER
jgi:hypothetical protein